MPKSRSSVGTRSVGGLTEVLDSPEVVPGLAELLPVARYVPGCPPPPSTLLDAIQGTAAAHV